MARLFPMFLRLEGRHCLLVGAGTVASDKVEGLLSAGAFVHVVAPKASDRIRELAGSGRVRWSQREFESSDLDEVSLVVAATGNLEINEAVFREAHTRRVLCNAVDDPDRCDFYHPAVVRRGDLQIAISTAGNSPALAQRIRRDLEKQFGPEYESWVGRLGIIRNRLFRRSLNPAIRRRTLHRVATRYAYERFVLARRRKAGQ